MANKNIRGITIEIGGDTTKLGKALEDSEKKSRSLQVELREIQKGLKFDPTNVELLSQKQSVLTSNIAETSEKLDVLKEAERQVIAQFERGEVAEEQVRALQREIITTEGVLGSMKKELTSTTTTLKNLADGTDSAEKHTKEYKESVEKAKKELEDFKGKASDAFEVLGKGTVALGTGAVATAGFALKISTEFDKAFNTIQTQTGATTEEMESLEESMTNIYKANLGENMEDVAQAMATVKQNTFLTGEELQKVTEDAIIFRDTFGFEVEESIRSASMLAEQFGLSFHEAYNLMAQGAQQGLNKNGDLMDVINEYSVHFEQMGFSAEDMFNTLSSGAESGAFSVDKVGDAFKEFGIRVKDESDSTMGAFTALGLNAEEISKAFAKGGDDASKAYQAVNKALTDLDDPLKQNQAGVALYGTMWEDLGSSVILEMANMNDQYNATYDSMSEINNIKYDDIGSAIQGLGRTLETDVVQPLGEELKPVVEDVIEYVQENGPEIKEILSNIVKSIGEFIGWIVDNKDAVIATIVAIGTGLAVWNVVSMINGVVGAIKAFKLANEGATIAQWAMNVAMNANPIGIIITAITALVGAFIYLWNNCESFREFFINLWENIKSAVGVAIEAIVGFFSGLWSKIVEIFSVVVTWWYENVTGPILGFFSELWTNVSQGVVDWWNGIVAFVVGIVTWWYENVTSPILNFFVGLWEGISQGAINLWNKIVEIFTPAIEWFSSLFGSIRDTLASIIDVIVGIASGCWEIIKAVFSIVATWFNENVIQPVVNFFTSLWSTIGNLAKKAWNFIVSVFVGAVTWYNEKIIIPIRTAFTNFWNAIRNLASNAWNGIKSIWSAVTTWFNEKIIQPVAGFFTGMWSKLKNGARDAWNGIKSIFSKVGSFFSDTFSKAWSKVKSIFSAGGKIFSGIKDGIVSAFKKIVNAIISGINKVVSVPFNAINAVLDKIRGISILGLSPFKGLGSISVPQIPQLYQGGVLKKGQVGLLEGNGAEAVVPLEKETGWINRIAQKMNDLQTVNNPGNEVLGAKMDEMINTMKALKSTIVLDTGTLVGETINKIDEQLGANYSLRERRI